MCYGWKTKKGGKKGGNFIESRAIKFVTNCQRFCGSNFVNGDVDVRNIAYLQNEQEEQAVLI